MAVTLTGTGGLFTRLGKILGTIDNVNGFRGSTAPNPSSTWGASGPEISAIQTNIDGIQAEFQSALQYVTDGLYTALSSFRSTQSGLLSTMRQLAQTTLVEQVHADTKLDSKTVANAMVELIRQMENTSDDVDANTVTASVAAAASNTGDGTVVASVKDVKGKTLEYAFNETLNVEATSDAGLGSTSGQEPFTASGDAAEADTLSYLWPAGSGSSRGLTAIDAGSTSSSLLTNGDFDTFTTNTPGTWTIGVGVAGTDIFAAGSSDDYQGDNALEFTGTGGTPLSELYQAVTTLKPNRVYHFCCWVKKSVSLAAGVLSIALTDGSGTIINDDASTANNTTIAHGSITTSYAAFSGSFRTPKVLPSTVRLRVKITTALTSGESLFVDHLSLAEATQVYTGGPFLSVHSGATAFAKGDRFTVTVSNNWASEFQKGFERLFGMRSLGLVLPSDTGGTETIADTLVG